MQSREHGGYNWPVCQQAFANPFLIDSKDNILNVLLCQLHIFLYIYACSEFDTFQKSWDMVNKRWEMLKNMF